MRKSTRLLGLVGICLLFMLLGGCGSSSSGSDLMITGVEPAQGVVGGGTEITVTGSGFGKGVMAVTLGWVNATDVVLVDDSTIRCVTPAHAHGLCDVGVALTDGGIVMPDAFNYISPEPTLTRVSPDEGGPGVNTRITLEGTGFLFEPVTVTVGGESCSNVIVSADTMLSCNVPSSGSGQDLTVVVTTDGGSASLEDAYSYIYAFRGTYFVAGFNGLNLGGVPRGETLWGRVASDGLGSFTDSEIWTNSQGAVDGPFPAPSIPYHVDGARTFFSGDPADPEAVGRLSEDGSLAILGSVMVGTPASLTIAGRVEGSYDLGSLSGLYHVCIVFANGPLRGALWGETDFDPARGEAESVFDNNIDGGIGGPYAGTDPYSVEEDGRVIYTWSDVGQTFEGQILQNGALVVLAGGNADLDAPVMIVMVRASSSAMVTSFSGDYAFAAMLQGNPAWDANTGLLHSVGDGDGTVLDLLGHDGDVTWDDWPQAPFPFSYDVGPNGMLDLSVDPSVSGGAMEIRGAVMPGNTFAVGSGSLVTGQRAMLWMFLR